MTRIKGKESGNRRSEGNVLPGLGDPSGKGKVHTNKYRRPEGEASEEQGGKNSKKGKKGRRG